MLKFILKALRRRWVLALVLTLIVSNSSYVRRLDAVIRGLHPYVNPVAAVAVGALIVILLTGLWIRWIAAYRIWVAVITAPVALLYAVVTVAAVASGQISAGLWATVLLFGPVVYLLSKSGTFRGWYGEQRVAKRLHLLRKRHPGTFHIFNNVLLQNARHSCEIDHVVLSPFGIFVIETKSHKTVHISEDGRWFHGGKEGTAEEFRSPFEQNKGHIGGLRALFGEAHYISMVALPGRKLTGYKPKNVLRLHEVYPSIASYAHEQPVIEPSRVRWMAETLNNANKTDKATRREHVRRARARQSA